MADCKPQGRRRDCAQWAGFGSMAVFVRKGCRDAVALRARAARLADRPGNRTMNEVTASNGLVTRCLMRTELPALWTIDRRERVDEVYAVVDGQLTLRREFYDTRGWPEGEPESQAPLLLACFDRGGIFRGVFDGGRLVAASVLDSAPVADWPLLRQMAFLHVSHDRRGLGLASMLYDRCMEDVHSLGGSGLYISATSTRRTVDFYRAKGARLAARPDRHLYGLEPDDIHLIRDLAAMPPRS